MSYTQRQTVRTFVRAGFEIIGVAAIRDGVVIVRRDSAWLVSRRGDMATAVRCLTTHDAINAADRLASRPYA